MNFCFYYFLSLAYVEFLTRPKRDPKSFLMVVPMMIYQLKGASITFYWGEEQQHSFDKIKVALATTPILAIVDPQKLFLVETNVVQKQWVRFSF